MLAEARDFTMQAEAMVEAFVEGRLTRAELDGVNTITLLSRMGKVSSGLGKHGMKVQDGYTVMSQVTSNQQKSNVIQSFILLTV